MKYPTIHKPSHPSGGCPMEKWRRIWREGLAPNITKSGLQALEMALIHDDARLLQGTTCYPPLLDALRDRDVEGTCALGFSAWQGDGLNQVGQVEEFFQRVCDGADAVFNEPAACRYFLNWFDDTPRDEMRRELLAEVEKAIADRLPIDRPAIEMHPNAAEVAA